MEIKNRKKFAEYMARRLSLSSAAEVEMAINNYLDNEQEPDVEDMGEDE